MSSASGVEELGEYIPAGSAEDRKFPFILSPLYGKIPAPQTLSGLFQYLEDIGPMSLWECWRGQADIGWRLDSTAARRMREHDTDIQENIYKGTFEERIRNYEDRLVNQARMAGHGVQRGRELSDLELLSVLRHYGAATRLMDFSRNVLVALWFACTGSENLDKHGLLVGLETNNARRVQTERELKRPITRLIDEKVRDNTQNEEGRRPGDFWYWEPRHHFERMRVQQSLFIFGRAAEHDWGTAPFALAPPGTKRHREAGDSILMPEGPALIAVSPDLKFSMEFGRRSYWRELFGYDARSLFPDLEGFSTYHGATEDFESDFFLT